MPDQTLPCLAEARSALAELATQDAVAHLEAALRSMEGLPATLRGGERLAPAEKRTLERSLLRFRTELRDAQTLAEQGLAYCQEWADLMAPPPAYRANGAVTCAAPDRHELSIQA